MKTATARFVGIFALFLSFYSLSAFADTSVEVVQSVPLETSLAVPGLRQAQAVWIEMIQSAKTTLDLEQFYISDQAGEALAPVLQEIKNAAARGVQVRLLVDSKFYVTYPDSVNDLGSVQNIQAKTIDYSKIGGGVQHAKFFVIDHRLSFVGSQNFDWRALSHIHEVGLKILDSQVAIDLESIFEKDWAQGTSSKRDDVIQQNRFEQISTFAANIITVGSTISVVASPENQNPSGIPYSGTAITDLMAQAKSTIRIQVMEYVAGQWKLLDSAIRAAAARGVHVQLAVDVSDIKKAHADLQALAGVSGVEVKSVTIPQWSGGSIPFARLIHSKYMVIDDQAAWVGSENWSKGYYLNTRDVGLVVHGADTAASLNQIFALVWQSDYTASVSK